MVRKDLSINKITTFLLYVQVKEQLAKVHIDPKRNAFFMSPILTYVGLLMPSQYTTIQLFLAMPSFTDARKTVHTS